MTGVQTCALPIFGGDSGSLGVGDGCVQDLGVRSEILRDAQSAAKFGDGHLAIGSGVGIDKFSRGGAGLNLIRQGHGGIVEEQDHVATDAGVCLSRCVDAAGKRGDLLLLVVFEDFEVALLQIVDVVAFFVGDDGVDDDEFRFGLDRKSTRLNSSHRSLSRMPSSA